MNAQRASAVHRCEHAAFDAVGHAPERLVAEHRATRRLDAPNPPVGLEDDVVRAFTQAPRIGRIAAELMGVRGVRIYCEDWLLKRPGAGETPWHQDCCVFPFETAASITAWIPIHDVPQGMGLPRYARGSQGYGVAPVENISEESNIEFKRLIAEHGFEVQDLPHLTKVLKAVSRVKGVLSVERRESFEEGDLN